MKALWGFLTCIDMICVYRLIIAGLCGVLIGWERRHRSKEAGVRTHCIVACASALMMIVSKYGFFDLLDSGLFPGTEVKLDPSRMAQGIVTGIGFLGAGMIFINKNVVKGLTTAAGIWATSGIGMAIGAGMYFVGLSMTALLLFIQYALRTPLFVFHTAKIHTLHVSAGEEAFPDGYGDFLRSYMDSLHITVTDISLKKKKDVGITDYLLTIEVPGKVTEEEIARGISYDISIRSNG